MAGWCRETSFPQTEPFNGKIYLASEALKLGLIDDIGYEAKAFEEAGKLAGLTKMKVVQYERHHNLMEQLLQAKGPGLNLDAQSLDELQTPRILMIWRGQ